MRRLLLVLALVTTLTGFGLVSVPVASALAPVRVTADALKQDACSGLNQVDTGTKADCSNLDTGQSSVDSITSTIVTILSFVVGAVAVIMVLVAAFKYITSGGDSNRISSAKSSLIYALIGIAIAGLAQILVTFVLSKSAKQ